MFVNVCHDDYIKNTNVNAEGWFCLLSMPLFASSEFGIVRQVLPSGGAIAMVLLVRSPHSDGSHSPCLEFDRPSDWVVVDGADLGPIIGGWTLASRLRGQS